MASAITKPTVFIVPGAWHAPSTYSQLATQLETAGFPTVAVPLPSVNSANPLAATCAVDVDSVREKLISLIEADGKDIVMIAHSYGGVPTGGAAHGLSKLSRTQDGKSGGVLGLVYMSAHAVPEGTTVLGYLGMKEYSPFVKLNQPSEGLCIASQAIETFFHDVDPETAESLAASLSPQATLVFESPTPAPAWAEPAYQGKLAYLRCTQDRPSPLMLQDLFWQRSGVDWIVRNIESGHSPFASKTGEVVEFISELVEKFST